MSCRCDFTLLSKDFDKTSGTNTWWNNKTTYYKEEYNTPCDVAVSFLKQLDAGKSTNSDPDYKTKYSIMINDRNQYQMSDWETPQMAALKIDHLAKSLPFSPSASDNTCKCDFKLLSNFDKTKPTNAASSEENYTMPCNLAISFLKQLDSLGPTIDSISKVKYTVTKDSHVRQSSHWETPQKAAAKIDFFMKNQVSTLADRLWPDAWGEY